MKTYELIMSIDGIYVDAVEEIKSETEPGFWECYEIAQNNGCDYFHLEEINQ